MSTDKTREASEGAAPVAAVEAVMEQAQVFASAWSLVGGRFDRGGMLEDANQAKAELQTMVERLATTPQPAVNGAGLSDATRFTNDPREHHRVIEGVNKWLAAYNLPPYAAPTVPPAEAVKAEPSMLEVMAVEELCQLGYTLADGRIVPPENLHKLIQASGHPLATRPAPPAEAQPAPAAEIEPSEHTEELSEAEIGAALYRGNTVSFMYDKARAYGDALTDTWDVLKEFGHRCDGQTRLRDKLREVLTRPAAPLSEPTAEGVRSASTSVLAALEADFPREEINMRDVERLALAALSSPASSAGMDAQRLDWLETQGEAYGFSDIHEGNRWVIDGPFATARQAIDAAMSATPGGGK